MRKITGSASALALVSALWVASPASATQIFVSNATIGGTTFGFNSSAAPWTAEVFASPGQCLRLAVLSQGTDLKMTVVAPNGAVFRDDDGGGSLRPLVKINGTPNNGWYTVSINHFAGNAVTANFQLQIQRLGLNDASCLPATTPFAAAAAAKSGGAMTSPKAGEPGH